MSGTAFIVACRSIQASLATCQITAAIVHIRIRVVVAGIGICAPSKFEWVAQSVLVGILQAIAIAIEILIEGIGAFATADGRRCIVITGGIIGTSHTTGVVTIAIVDHSILIVVAGHIVGATGTTGALTAAIVKGGVGIEVACEWIRTSFRFQLITDVVFIDIVQTVAVAVLEVLRICAAAIRHRRRLVIVTCRTVQTTRARVVVTRAVIQQRRVVIIARRWVRAAATTGRITTSVIECCSGIIVAANGVGASSGLVLIADAVQIGIV